MLLPAPCRLLPDSERCGVGYVRCDAPVMLFIHRRSECLLFVRKESKKRFSWWESKWYYSSSEGWEPRDVSINRDYVRSLLNDDDAFESSTYAFVFVFFHCDSANIIRISSVHITTYVCIDKHKISPPLDERLPLMPPNHENAFLCRFLLSDFPFAKWKSE